MIGRERITLLRLVAVFAAASLLASCHPPAPPAVGATPGAARLAGPTATLPPSPTPEPTRIAATPVDVGAPTPVPVKASLVSLQGEAVFAGDGWGGGSRQVLALGPATSVAFRDGRLAYVANGAIMLADLDGEPPRRLGDAPPAFLLGPDLAWTADGQALLTIADREDARAPETGRSIDIGVVVVADGAWRPALALADRAGATVVHAASAGGPVLLVAWGATPSFREVVRYDLSGGHLLAALPIAGEGWIVPSPDGHLAATLLFDPDEGANVLRVHSLLGEGALVEHRLVLPGATHAAGAVWSPDGKRIAYLLRQGERPAEGAGAALGIWIWGVETGMAVRVLGETDATAGPVAWTPDGQCLVYRHVDAAGARAYYALDVASSRSFQLPLDSASRVLGWKASS